MAVIVPLLILGLVLGLCVFGILTYLNRKIDSHTKVRRTIAASIGTVLGGGVVGCLATPSSQWFLIIAIVGGVSGWLLLVGRGGHIAVDRQANDTQRSSRK